MSSPHVRSASFNLWFTPVLHKAFPAKTGESRGKCVTYPQSVHSDTPCFPHDSTALSTGGP